MVNDDDQEDVFELDDEALLVPVITQEDIDEASVKDAVRDLKRKHDDAEE